ncbi:DUF1508 domain-containing protein [Flavobacterium amnicola]|uniref:DUF1508 domain-containing protein n=1 Tax=Flavobacterium amnicola TaxID=2506422 RepID=A0A4Q1K4B6_9FLAO|nr:DUF1508 domain-containing protein [Flavobacterium amnicola]RXR20693.1 DUF1508 domain-containing protein [Flavobacterium amnicola]
MATFVISRRLSDDFKFEFVSRRGKTILTSDSYELRYECEEDIEIMKKALPEAVFMKFRTSSGKFYFRLIIGKKEYATSRKYTTQLLMQKGIDEIMRSMEISEVLDFSSNEFAFPEIEFQD